MNPFDSSSSIYYQKVEFSNGEDSGAGSEEGLDMTDEPIKTNPHRSGSKRSRAAEVHNMFEKRRRSGINEKMKALQNLIPNSNKAFAEWVLFTSSGISSRLYHACDVGTWCVLSFWVLQFMDFWLSFMAVISTFIYMATISETSKRAIHTVVAIITALLAVTGATRSANIVLVVVIGTLGLFVGWLLEFLTSYHFTFHTVDWNFYATDSWRNIKRWFRNLINTLNKRFHWPLVGICCTSFCWDMLEAGKSSKLLGLA